MKISRAFALYFSPTGTTKHISSIIAGGLPLPVEKIDLTPASFDYNPGSFGGNDLVIFSVPVYGGRVPAVAIERIKEFSGNRTPALITVVYGNRDYDDALLELSDVVAAQGFIPVAGGAFIAEHSIFHEVAAGRPDAADISAINDFTAKAWQKLAGVDSVAGLCLEVKGKRPYMVYNGVPFKPSAGSGCVKCGRCADNCPVGAIPAKAPNQTDEKRCISCMRCIKLCPQKARKLPDMVYNELAPLFAKKCAMRREAETFLGEVQ